MATELRDADEVFEIRANDADEDAAEGEQDDPQASRGYLLDCPDPEAVKTLREWWKDGEKDGQRLAAIELVNLYARKGVRGAAVALDEDTSQYTVKLPKGAKNAPPQPNKLDDLVRGVVSSVTADPVVLEAEPSTDDDKDRDSAAFASRLLKSESDESGLNVPTELAAALDRALTACSHFTLVTLDPTKGGMAPLTIEAYPTAQTVDDATTLPPMPEPQIDPMTGQPLPVEPPPPMELVTRYVAEDGVMLTDEPSEAQTQWIPQLVLTGHAPRVVRWLPPTAETLEDAHGVMVGRVLTLGRVKREWPEVFEALGDEEIANIVAYRPPRAKSWLDPAQEALAARQAANPPKYADGTLADHALVWVLSAWFTACPEYPEGATLHVFGEKHVARDGWMHTDEEGQKEALELPVAHLMGLSDPEGHPYGMALCDKLRPADEVRGGIEAAVQEYCYRFGRPVQYVPSGSVIRPIDLARRDGTPISYNAEGGTPVFEQVPPFPPTLFEFYDRKGAEMESAAALPPPTQGYASANIKSGEHMQRVLEQSQQQLSQILRHAGDYCARLGRILLQQMRAFYTLPRLIGYTTEDGAYEAREWSKVDLGTTKDVKVSRGSLTMLPRSAKQALAREELEMALKLQDPMAVVRQRRALTGNTSPLLGIEDEPHRRRVLRQIRQWEQGPQDLMVPDEMTGEVGLPPVPPPIEQMTQQVDPASGMPVNVPQMVPQPDPVVVAASRCFEPTPADEEPSVAQQRWYELSRVMASVTYTKQDPRWRQGLEQAYRAARQAAGVKTLAEQQAEQAAAQQQQQQAQMAEAQAKQEAQMGYARQAQAEAEEQAQENAMRAAESQRAESPLVRGA